MAESNRPAAIQVWFWPDESPTSQPQIVTLEPGQIVPTHTPVNVGGQIYRVFEATNGFFVSDGENMWLLEGSARFGPFVMEEGRVIFRPLVRILRPVAIEGEAPVVSDRVAAEASQPIVARLGDSLLNPGDVIPNGAQGITIGRLFLGFYWGKDGQVQVFSTPSPPRMGTEILNVGVLSEGQRVRPFVMMDGKVVFWPDIVTRPLPTIAAREAVPTASETTKPVFNLSAFWRNTGLTAGIGYAALGLIKFIEYVSGEKMNGWAQAGIFGGAYTAFGVGAARIAGQPFLPALLSNTASIPAGFIASAPISMATALLEAEMGMDPSGTGGVAFNIGVTSILATAASNAVLPTAVAGFTSAAEAGVSLTGIGLSAGAGAAVAVSGIVGYALGTGFVRVIAPETSNWTSQELTIHARSAWEFIRGIFD